MWVLDIDTLAFLEVNDAAVADYGYAREEFLGMKLPDIRPPGDAARSSALMTPGGTIGDGDVWPYLRRDGGLRHVEIRSSDVSFAGRAARLVVARDVSRVVEIEQRRSELMLRERTAHRTLREIATLQRIAGRTARVGGWRVDLRSGVSQWSEETAEIHGAPELRQVGLEEALAFYESRSGRRIRAAFRACADRGEAFDETLQLRRADGRMAWVRAIGEAEFEDGVIRGVSGALQDITELVQTRREHAELGRRLTETVESIGDPFFTLDLEWRFTFLNREAERVLQRDRAGLLGRSLWEEFPAAIGGPFEKAYRGASETGETVRFTAFYPPLSVWVHVTAHPTSRGIAVYFRDVTQERTDQQQLRLLETAVSRINDMLLITEAQPFDAPEGPKVVYVNDAFVRLTGFSRDDILGNTPRILQGPNTQRFELDRIRSSLEAGEAVRSELINYTKAGEEVWLELDIVPLGDGERPSHFVAIQRDVTARKRDESAVRESEQRFRLVTRATNDVVWEWDIATGEIWWNENFRTAYGHSTSEEKTTLEFWSELVHPEDRERVLEGLDSTLEGSDSTWAAEYRLRRADGSYAHVVDRGFLLRDRAGGPTKMVGSLLDVTERLDLENSIRQAQKLEAIGQLTGGVAHDFNNLLTIILGNAEVLADALKSDPALRELAEMTAGAAERGAELTGRLLAFARRQALEPKALNPRTLVCGMEALVRRTLPEGIELQVRCGPDLGTIEADASQLEVALLNLAINARDAMPDGGRLTVEVRRARRRDLPRGLCGDWTALVVSDTGEGMSPETLSRAFEPFYTTKPVGKGSGLGLSMVYGFVKQSGGEAHIRSAPGGGCAVTLLFPRTADGAAPEEPDNEAAELRGAGEHILVVEDDEAVRSHLTSKLRGLGYRVTAAPGADEALAQLADMRPDLLFTDVVMPGALHGGQLAERARLLIPGLKVLFTSGYAQNALVEGGRLKADVHLLRKPYRRRELAAKVREVLSGGSPGNFTS